ncbi:MAG: SPOR domain-containing protein [Alphaproteobacteria bacterium]|nr:SPOR domain-containing protein [Alphaproteobacteria bacterium]
MAEQADNMRYENASYADEDGVTPRKAKTKTTSRKLSLILWGLVLLSVCGAGFVWFGSSADQNNSDITVLRPDQGPFKVKPIESGGLEIETSNTTVLNMLDGTQPSSEGTETLVLPDGQPELPPVQTTDLKETPDTPSTSTASGVGAMPAPNQTAGAIPPATAPAAAQGEAASESKTNDGTQVIIAKRLSSGSDDIAGTSGSDDTASEPDTKSSASVSEASEIASPVARPKLENRVIKKQIIEPDLSNPDLFMVQLAAFRNREKAETASALLTEKHNQRLMGLMLGVMQVEAKNSTMFWRVITEPLPPKDARKICGDLKRSGQDCILRKATPVRP